MAHPRVNAALATAGAALVAGLVAIVYREALSSNFFNDDFHWLFDTRRFAWGNLLHLERYDHFYRPVIEIYFYAGLQFFGCAPAPFHALSLGIHLFNTLVLFLFARSLTASDLTAAVAVLLFCVQPGYVEAVTWVGAITDLLPATWVLLSLWLHLQYLQRGRWWAYAGTFAAFVLCLGTHESAVTILPMLIALDALVASPARFGDAGAWVGRRVARYAPHAVMLTAFLVVAYLVNSRSYLVRDGYYALGWHAVSNIFDYVAWLYVGRRRLTWHVGVALVIAAIVWKGTPRMRFFLVWIVVTLLPVSFFTWGGASRYLYVPAAGFALLLADLVMRGSALAAMRLPRRATQVVTALVVAVLVGRFATFAEQGVAGFRQLTRPYDRFTEVVRTASRSWTAPGEIRVTPGDVENIPALYYDAAAETALCITGVHVVVE